MTQAVLSGKNYVVTGANSGIGLFSVWDSFGEDGDTNNGLVEDAAELIDDVKIEDVTEEISDIFGSLTNSATSILTKSPR